MSLLETWREEAYEIEGEENQEKFWQEYFDIEKRIYSEILDNPGEAIKGKMSDLANHFNTDILHFTGFLDGINTSLTEAINLEEMEENTELNFTIDTEKLYYNMHGAKADWLYNLPQWDNILTVEKRKEIEKEERLSGTVIKGEKIGRNDPCPCGSGKKYKKCCGANN
ncbi:SEC-C metal-binding domain-containing protein [Tissierella sp.]|uniref:SEC-C metal-binding domain-containing protein n=1 Tax=Tissierella sp. TaxID=41274 RepID=UPI00285958B2|nr:SEC-C metal-binding domain-containing protein [Tissierella sp.]MDR7855793.1 SEC-C metal-binding domain-containing protein [Tissierella sp.]